MSMLAERTEPARYRAARRRVVVKMKDAAAQIHALRAAADTRNAAGDDVWTRLQAQFPGASLGPYFREAAPPPGRSAVPRAAGAETDRYLAIDVPQGAEADAIADLVKDAPDVETAYAEGGPTPPPVEPSDDPRSANQGYLGEAPGGVDARWAWSMGVDGSGVGFVDLEQGWTLSHEDVPPAIEVISGLSLEYHGHGTAVLGELCASDNSIGCIGLAPSAEARVVSQWRAEDDYRTAEAIVSAVAVMQPGDVLLLEAQTRYSTSGRRYVPVEVEEAVFVAIRSATDAGIIVVEAAGNGSVDLDAFQDVNGRQILNRNSSDFRDSGAIIVGAASSAAPHSRMSFSNFGSRVDCYAWGENVDTCGDGGSGNQDDSYTADFSGTSSASPMIAGAALLLQHWRELVRQPRLGPAAMRQLLSDPAQNTTSAAPDDDRIGAMPNLRALMESEMTKLDAPGSMVAKS